MLWMFSNNVDILSLPLLICGLFIYKSINSEGYLHLKLENISKKWLMNSHYRYDNSIMVEQRAKSYAQFPHIVIFTYYVCENYE